MDNFLAERRILVVEDETLIMMMVEDMLSDLGCTSVFSAATVDQALAVIAAEPLDAAILDVNLGGNLSYPVADALVAKGVPFAFASGGTGEGYGDRPVLTKPFVSEDLAGALTRLLSDAPSGAGTA